VTGLVASVIFWTLILILVRPKPASLRDPIPNHWQSFVKIQMTYWLGVSWIVIFYISSSQSFAEISEEWLVEYGVNNVEIFTPRWFLQLFTNGFLHLNFLHLYLNIVMFGLLSLYERQVGSKRFLTVFLVSSVLSSLSILLLREPTVSVGASSGIFGIAAAYMLDSPKLNIKEFLIGVLTILILFLFLSLAEDDKGIDLDIDHLAHLSGILFGAAYCKLFPRNSTGMVNREAG